MEVAVYYLYLLDFGSSDPTFSFLRSGPQIFTLSFLGGDILAQSGPKHLALSSSILDKSR